MNKIQYNVKEAKPFRTIMAKFHNAKHELANYIAETTKKGGVLDSAKTALNEDANDLFTLKTGTEEEKKAVVRTLEEVEKSYTASKARVDRVQDDLSKARDKANKACEDALALVTPELYAGYCTIGTDDDNFGEVIAKWFIAQGFADATAENCDYYARWFGSKDKRNTARKICEKKHLRSNMTKKDFTSAWMEALADDLQDAGIINAYKYTFVPSSKKAQ